MTRKFNRIKVWKEKNKTKGTCGTCGVMTPHSFWCLPKNTKWTVPLWSLGFSALETYITCAIWGKDAQTETGWIWILFELLWRSLKRKVWNDTGGWNNLMSCDNMAKVVHDQDQRRRHKKKMHVVLVRKNTPLLLFVFAKNTNKQYLDARHIFLDQSHM